MDAAAAQAMPGGHREMLIGGLRSIFGEFDVEMLERVLPRLEWVHLAGGDVLFRQGERDESLYFVISGRLRVLALEADGSRTTLGEVARGETVGEMAFFTGEARTATVTAVRDSVLARFTGEVFRELLQAYPLVSLNMTRLVIERLKRVSARRPVAKPVTIGVAAITGNVDARDFAGRLHRMLSRYGKSTVLTSSAVDRSLGERGAADAPVADSPASRRLAALLERVESEHQFVLFVADAGPSGWSGRCLRHCDEILLVADADQPEALHPVESRWLGAVPEDRGQVARTLVLLHPDGRRSPAGTARWLRVRQLAHHVHVRRECPADWQRLGRIVSGNAVGLVLSGGGARGFTHLGVLKAMEEAGLSCDLVGGTSIGAVMGAYAAMDLPVDEVIRLAREAFRRSPTRDYNLVPLVSLLGGRRLRSVIDGAVLASCGASIDIEDLWKGYFCISSNYSTARESVLTTGPLARSIRASVSIPGALPPVLLGGELHIDGGTFNNFPTDVMSRMGAARIIGVNLLRDRNFRYELEEVPGPMALLRDKLLRRKRQRLPSLTSLLLNTTMMHSYARQRESQALADLYFAPDVQRFGLLEWGAFDRLVDAGLRHGRAVLEGLDPALASRLRHAEEPLHGAPEWATNTTRILRLLEPQAGLSPSSPPAARAG